MSADLIARGLASRAAASARSPNTQALILAIRNWGAFAAPSHRLATTDLPAVTIGAAGAASTINAQTAGGATVPRFDSRLTYVAGPTRQAGTTFPLNGYAVSRSGYCGALNALGDPFFGTQYHAYEFVHTGSQFEVPVTGHGANSLYNLRLVVDDAVAATAAVPSGNGNLYFVKFVFGASRARRIRIETAAVPTNGVNVISASEVSSVARAYPLVTIIGDSFVEPTGADFSANGEAALAARLLGLRGAIAGVGGTGLINPGGNNSAGFPKVNFCDPTRMTDLTLAGVIDAQTGSTLSPALGVVMSSVNDGAANGFASVAGATSFEDAVTRQAFKLIDAWRSTNPGKPLVFFGPTWPNATPTLDIFRQRDAVQRAVQGAGGARANVWFIDRLGPSAILRHGAVDTLATTGTTTSGSATLTALASTAGVVAQSGISGPGIPEGAVVLTVVSSTSVTISHPCTASGTVVAIRFRNNQSALYTSLVAGDTTHPSPAGHEYDAFWIAAELRRLILNEFA
ncbi:hypothetical protein [Novosphingobium ginsenosidimutans]|uniref:Uncharacterized protein n=1 Tax=Novosphingobium ginsenosidimutans TaxID=1176536 RepID=A0A5B8S3S7_9SPHN|nr:hypothetical protein [Novosphingobium ginsenosidimutans]QEA16101.1 hypothetical protein FRF71_08105 [Novosphingobium ginsenosidimutans]